MGESLSPWDSEPVDRVKFFRDDAGEFRWRYVRTNGKIIATSGEGYGNLADAQEMAHYLFDGLHVSFELEIT